jgi:F-type H+-transporting ATPase subunit a
MAQFEIYTLIPIEIGGYDVSFTNASLWTVLAAGAAALFLTVTVKRDGIIPNRLQSMAELAYGFILDTVKESVGEAGIKYFPLVLTLFAFILFCNLFGMIPYSFTVTSHIAITFALAMAVFLLVIAVGFWKNGLGFLRLFAPADVPLALMPLIIPIEIISFLSRPISLSIRLAMNMLVGHTLLKVFAGFVGVLLAAGGLLSGLALAPLALNVAIIGLEFLIAALQAYVFAVLTCIYLNDAEHVGH